MCGGFISTHVLARAPDLAYLYLKLLAALEVIGPPQGRTPRAARSSRYVELETARAVPVNAQYFPKARPKRSENSRVAFFEDSHLVRTNPR